MFSFSTDVVFSQLNDLFQLAQLLLASARNSIALFSLFCIVPIRTHTHTQTHVKYAYLLCTLLCKCFNVQSKRCQKKTDRSTTMARLAPRLFYMANRYAYKCDKYQTSERKKRLNDDDIVEINFNLQWYAFECVYANCLRI